MPKKKTEGNTEPLDPMPDEIQVKVDEPVIEEAIRAQSQPVMVSETPKYSVEREGESGAISAKKLPNVIAGVCEFCGPGEYDHSSPQRMMVDWTVHPETQKGKCQHYKGITIRCSYCPLNAEWTDNIRHRQHLIFESPWDPTKLIIVCSDMACRDKHVKRSMQGRV